MDTQLQTSVCSDQEGFVALHEEWVSLAKTAGVIAASQSFEYASAARDVHPDGDFAIVEIRRAGELVGLWPLYTRVQGRLTVASHFTCGGNEEYSGPLIVNDGSAPEIAVAALRKARSLCDVLEVYSIAPDAPMAHLLKRTVAAKYTNTIVSPLVRLSAHSSLEAWFATKSKSFRSGLRYDRKRLSALGDLAFTRVSGSQGAEVVTWLFANKRDSLGKKGTAASWVFGGYGEPMFQGLVADPDGDIRGYAMTLDGRIAAACICFVSSRSLEFYMTGFEPEFGGYSPGNLMIEDCCRVAFDLGLDLDFRVGEAPYKLRWSDDVKITETLVVANTIRGAQRPLTFEARRALRVLRHEGRLMLQRVTKR